MEFTITIDIALIRDSIAMRLEDLDLEYEDYDNIRRQRILTALIDHYNFSERVARDLAYEVEMEMENLKDNYYVSAEYAGAYLYIRDGEIYVF